VKYGELVALQKELSKFETIFKAKRVNNNTIVLRFDKENEYGFVMTRGESTVYFCKQEPFAQNYNAPFDNMLESMLSYSKILSIEIVGNDRILRFILQAKNSYKTSTFSLQFEFTGRHTNVIFIDENGVTLEALRHIDSGKSFRVIRPGVELLEVLHREQKTDEIVQNIDEILRTNYKNLQSNELNQIKLNLKNNAQKQYNKFNKLLKTLPNEEGLEEELLKYNLFGSLALAYRNDIPEFSHEFQTNDFDGKPITIPIPAHISTNRLGDYYFTKVKKSKNRAIHIHLERENLGGKVEFYTRLLEIIKNASSTNQLSPFLPQNSTQKREKKTSDEVQVFWVEGHKVLIGRNKNENKKILSLAKANDIWFHIQGIPSSHVIIKTDKQSLAQSVIYTVAKLCIDFSTNKAGEYKVDYTKRKFIKPQDEANVFYTNYDTITVTKDGIEIRT
jgi:predicted ribosome quality control (RQC) complex YloA/Tae2 family protein